ncbi:MAG: class SAM-dependent methyltransferase [Flaviaesturariibacter sp.]|nr:class SAM-dependent methyltransferase [Flaviaesturariibacter sp.]
MPNVHYSHCPVCSSTSIEPRLVVRDHTVSGKEFAVWQCGDCTLRFTQDVPDATDIGPYYKAESYISHTNTSKGLINNLYQKVRALTLKQKASTIAAATGLSTGRLLDVGCGTGAFLNAMKKEGWQVTGLEPDADARRVARELYRVEPLEASMLQDLPPASFDAITLWHVLEHVHELHGTVAQLRKLLKPGGKLMVAVPNYTSQDEAIYGQNWAAYDVPRHLYHFTPRALTMLMERHGLRVIAKKPMWFDSFYISMLSSQYKNGKTNWIGASLAGIRSNLKATADHDRCSSLTYIIEQERG